LKGSKRLLTNLTAGSVWFEVGNPGVDRTMESEDSSESLGEKVIVRVPATLRCRSKYSTPKDGARYRVPAACQDSEWRVHKTETLRIGRKALFPRHCIWKPLNFSKPIA
jgi:hypothetical protein